MWPEAGGLPGQCLSHQLSLSLVPQDQKRAQVPPGPALTSRASSVSLGRVSETPPTNLQLGVEIEALRKSSPRDERFPAVF